MVYDTDDVFLIIFLVMHLQVVIWYLRSTTCRLWTDLVLRSISGGYMDYSFRGVPRERLLLGGVVKLTE